MSGLSCGIVGLPNVGKSTLFNALTKKGVPAANYPFCTIDPNVGIVELPDPRLGVLSKFSKSKKIIPATVTFVDIAGLVEGASEGAGLGNKFLGHIRETDAILQMVRCFESEEITHVSTTVDPVRDVEVINLELAISDLQLCQNVLDKMEKQAKSKRELVPVVAILKRAAEQLDKGQPLRTLSMTAEESAELALYPFLTLKPLLYVANVDEGSIPSFDNPLIQRLRTYAETQGAPVIPICAKLEEELASLTDEEASAYLESLGVKESGMHRLIRESFSTLGLITFLTTGEIETRAWTIPQGFSAQRAAGKIHTDIEKGFIRAEVIGYDDFVACKGRVHAREAGKARAEGKEYIVRDGDVILFFHN